MLSTRSITRHRIPRGPSAAPAIALGLVASVCAAALWPTSAFACTCAEQPRQEAFETADAVFEGQVAEIASAPDRASSQKGMPGGDLQVRLHVVRAWKGVPPMAEELTVRTARSGGACGYAFKAGESYLVYAYAPGAPKGEPTDPGSTEKVSEEGDASVQAEGQQSPAAADKTSQKAAATPKPEPASDGPQLRVSRCSRTRPVVEAEQDIIAMGMGVVTVDPRLPAEEKKAISTPSAPRSRPAGCASCEIGERRDAAGRPFGWALACMAVALAAVVGRRRRRDR